MYSGYQNGIIKWREKSNYSRENISMEHMTMHDIRFHFKQNNFSFYKCFNKTENIFFYAKVMDFDIFGSWRNYYIARQAYYLNYMAIIMHYICHITNLIFRTSHTKPCDNISNLH